MNFTSIINSIPSFAGVATTVRSVLSLWPIVISVAAIATGILFVNSQKKSKASPIPPIVIQSINKLIEMQSMDESGDPPELFYECFPNRKKFEEEIWFQLKLPPCCGSSTDENAAFLFSKLKIVFEININVKLKQKICKNIITNFVEHLNEARRRIQTDLADVNFRNTFNIPSGCSVTSITPLGDETHRRGRIPLLITFHNGTKVVYKPRSMEIEQLICGDKGSIFSQFKKEGLDTYSIYNKKNQNYGYAEYIKSNGTELIMEPEENPSSLKLYADRFVLVDQIARLLGLSDLHDGNVITRRGAPLLIDAEVAMVPTDSDVYRKEGTGLVSLIGPSGYKFYSTNSHGSMNPATAIVLRETQNSETFNNNDSQMKLTTAIEQSKNAMSLNFSKKQQMTIQDVINKLAIEKHRILIINTKDLHKYINMSQKEGIKTFQTRLLGQARLCGFEITASTETLEKLFIDDMENNDVPIFYHKPKTGNLYYKDQIIGRRKQKQEAIVDEPVSEKSPKEPVKNESINPKINNSGTGEGLQIILQQL